MKKSLHWVFAYLGWKSLPVILLALSPFLAFTQKKVPPNIVIIFADDLGYGDLGCYGAEGYATPNLDRLAASGMRFTDFYASEAVCSASRSSLLTGCYSERIGVQGALSPGSKTGLNPGEVTIAEMLKERKYASAIFGKWHLGSEKMFLPLQQGFDEYFGLPYSNDMWPVGYDGQPSKDLKKNYPTLYLYEDNKPVRAVKTLEDQAELTTLYTERAVRFIREHRRKPFFLYLAHSMVHVPLGVSDKFKGKTERGMFGDVMEEVDWSVGEVIRALEENGLMDHTVILFTSDNGPWLNYGNYAGSAGPLREGKGTAFDGGVREPCIFYMKDVIPGGSVSTEMMTTMDVLPTLAAITGCSLPENEIDGKNFLPYLSGEQQQGPRDEFWYYYTGELRAIRKGRWKLVFPHYSVSYQGVEPGHDGYPGKYNYITTGLELYDLQEDAGETTDVSVDHPDIVMEMVDMANNARDELGDRLTGIKGSGNRPGRVYAGKQVTVHHEAVGKQVELNVLPSPRYAGDGPATLVDGKKGSMDFHDDHWLGFLGQDVEIIVDMGKAVSVKKFSCSFLENQGAWIFLPSEVTFLTSVDGKEYREQNSFQEELKERDKSTVKEYETLVKGEPSRYYKVVFRNAGPCPDWHPGKGQDSWVFLDEVMIK